MRRPVLLDTQLTALLTVGATSPSIIPRHKNLTAYDEDSYELFALLLGAYPRLLLVPNTVSEASNLLRRHREPERSMIMATFKGLIDDHREFYVESRAAVARPEYARLCITDSEILELSNYDCTLLTAYLKLYIAVAILDLPATNFNHERENFGLL